MNVSFSEFGEDARLARFAPAPGGRVLARLRRVLLARFPEWDVAIGDGCLLVVGEAVEERLVEALSTVRESDGAERRRSHEVPVIYDGPDLDACAEASGVSRSRLVELHTRPSYEVAFPGFLPGFAYLTGLPPELHCPRRSSPRPRVLAGSVAIAAEYSAIYPYDSPGGWHLLGRTLRVSLFDPERSPPALFEVGDEVRFVARAAASESSVVLRRSLEAGRLRSGIVVERAPPGTTLQDAGREGLLGLGLPPSGPVDPERYAAACRAVRSPEAAAVEVATGEFRLRACGRVWWSLDGEEPRCLSDGEPLVLPRSERNVRYLAVSGGLSGDVVFRSRSTHLLARLGGHLGRGLRAGDELAIAGEPGDLAPDHSGRPPDVAALEEQPDTPTIFLDPGPDIGAFSPSARSTLVETTWRVGRVGDRTGRRLVGGCVEATGLAARPSVPMRRGAVQIAGDGTPIVLGPDHPTTGGYPVIARVRPESFGAFGRLAPDSPLHLVFRNIRG